MRGRGARQRRIWGGLLAACSLVAAGASPASAGTYTVTGTCEMWTAWNWFPTGIAVYPTCPTLIARKVGGAFSTAAGSAGGWRFDAPAGASIHQFVLNGYLFGYNGWQAAGMYEGGSQNGGAWESCPGSTCPGAAKGLSGASYYGWGASAIVTRVRCGAASGSCSNAGAQDGYFDISWAQVTIADYTAPDVGLALGTLQSGSWQNGTRTVAVNAGDNTGIAYTQALVSPSHQITSPAHGCNWTAKAPCENRGDWLTINTATLSDGAHTLVGRAVDTAGNAASTSAITIYTDNTAPTAPLDLALSGGSGWRSVNRFGVTWRNPAQNAAPIAGASYRLCPTLPADAPPQQRSDAERRCVSGSRTGAGLARIDDIAVPSQGQWTLRLALRDAAGNETLANAATLTGLDLDTEPPTVAFRLEDPSDPARIRVAAGDALSGLASGSIELRRVGEDSWRPLATELLADGLAATVDEDALPDGLYELRATVSDRAGIRQTSDRRQDGSPATLRRPFRKLSHLEAALRSRQPLRAGTTASIAGRLQIGGQGPAFTPLEVYQRIEGAEGWTRIGTVTTNGGSFDFRSPNGPTRRLLFRFPASRTVRGSDAEVALAIRASTTIRARRGRGAVTFTGRLAGGSVPAGGVLVELQAFDRGRWRTFGQPRAAAASGAWSYRYRFTTLRARRTFRFRARVRRQPGYPFEAGRSRELRVSVRPG
jgi:hypothetical protein